MFKYDDENRSSAAAANASTATWSNAVRAWTREPQRNTDGTWRKSVTGDPPTGPEPT
jgi:hypothetical protein